MSEASYTAWDDNLYEWPPPEGWYQADDGKWWPEGFGPGGDAIPGEEGNGHLEADPALLLEVERTSIFPAGGTGLLGITSNEEEDDSQRRVYDELPPIDDVFGGEDPYAEPGDNGSSAESATVDATTTTTTETADADVDEVGGDELPSIDDLPGIDADEVDGHEPDGADTVDDLGFAVTDDAEASTDLIDESGDVLADGEPIDGDAAALTGPVDDELAEDELADGDYDEADDELIDDDRADGALAEDELVDAEADADGDLVDGDLVDDDYDEADAELVEADPDDRADDELAEGDPVDGEYVDELVEDELVDGDGDYDDEAEDALADGEYDDEADTDSAEDDYGEPRADDDESVDEAEGYDDEETESATSVSGFHLGELAADTPERVDAVSDESFDGDEELDLDDSGFSVDGDAAPHVAAAGDTELLDDLDRSEVDVGADVDTPDPVEAERAHRAPAAAFPPAAETVAVDAVRHEVPSVATRTDEPVYGDSPPIQDDYDEHRIEDPAVAHQPEPVGDERGRPWLLILGVVAVLGIGAAVLGFTLLGDSDEPEPGIFDIDAALLETEDGSINEPYSSGTGVVVYYQDDATGEQRRWVIQVVSAVADRSEELAAVDGAEAPADGEVYASTRIRVTYQSGPVPGDVSDLSLASIGPSLVLFDDQVLCPGVTDALTDVTALEPGQAIEGDLCWQIPAADLPELKLAVAAQPVAGTVFMNLN